jgi:tyrosyl-tRNA synthetase
MSAPGYAPNTAQRRLAEEVTRFVHGQEGLQQALNATEVRLGMLLIKQQWWWMPTGA